MTRARQKTILLLALPAALALSLLSAAAAFAQVSAEEVSTVFQAQYASFCATLRRGESVPAPRIYPLRFRYSYQEQSEAVRDWVLYEFECTQSAYSFGSVFYTVNAYDEVQSVQFAFPQFEVTREDPDDQESAVTGITITGYTARPVVVFPVFDPDTLSMRHFAKWRGPSDASSTGHWEFRDGEFVLTGFEVDASYDGEINPVPIYPED